jgi:hypothetical protein
MFEKKWAVVPVQLLVANGTTDGQLQIPDAFKLRVKQKLLLKSSTQPTIQVQVKRVISSTTLYVGSPDGDIDDRTNVSAYLVANGASVSNLDPNQPRPKIGREDYDRAVYEEEPVVAVRTVLVNRGGEFVGSDKNSPFYVQLTDGSINIETINAELRVQLSAKDNDPTAGDVHSSVRIGDGTNELVVNADGSFNVNVVNETPSSEKLILVYNEDPSVVTGVSSDLVTYTVPVGKKGLLIRAAVSGENIATFTILVNSIIVGTRRTYFGGDLGTEFVYGTGGSSGLELIAGDTVLIRVIHYRPATAPFEGEIQIIEIT